MRVPHFGNLYLTNIDQPETPRRRKAVTATFDNNPFAAPEKQGDIYLWGTKMHAHPNIIELRDSMRNGQLPDLATLRQKLVESLSLIPTRFDPGEREDFATLLQTAPVKLHLTTKVPFLYSFNAVFDTESNQWTLENGVPLENALKQKRVVAGQWSVYLEFRDPSYPEQK